MNDKPKCPILLMRYGDDDKRSECIASDCRLWISIHTTEGPAISMCTFEALGQKDEHGLIPV